MLQDRLLRASTDSHRAKIQSEQALYDHDITERSTPGTL